MPTTETQPSAGPASPPPEPPRSRRGGRRDYEGLEAYDLLHVIDDLEDERSRALLREKIWIALLLHIAVFAYILFAPKYIYHIKVVDPSTRMRENEKEMTFLNLPKDALKHIQPRSAPPVTAKEKAQAPRTTLDRKTLEAMRRSEPPAPKPAPAPPVPAPPQVAQQQPTPPPVQRPAQPLPQNQTSQVEAPAPRPTSPNFNTGALTPGEAVQQAERQASRGGQYSGGAGANAPSPRGGSTTGAPDILSDTLGVDFGPYIQRVIYDTKQAWYPIIPPSAQPPLSKQGKVMIRFKILPDGSVKNMILEGPSGDVSLDRAAWGGIVGASPYPQLPKNFKGPYLELRFYFLYNLRPGVE
jgi:TonB family protein